MASVPALGCFQKGPSAALKLGAVAFMGTTEGVLGWVLLGAAAAPCRAPPVPWVRGATRAPPASSELCWALHAAQDIACPRGL